MMDGRSQGEKKDMRGIGSRRTGRSLATLWHPYLEDAVGVKLVDLVRAVAVAHVGELGPRRDGVPAQRTTPFQSSGSSLSMDAALVRPGACGSIGSG